MSLGFPIDIEGDEEAGSSHRPNMTSGEYENATGAAAFPRASQNENADAFEPEEAESQQTNKQGEYTKISSNVNEKENCKKSKNTPESDSEKFLKGMVEYGTRASDVELAAAKKLSETWPSGNEEDCKSFIRQRIAAL
ncbi:hypothetical protein KY285_007867 [Solanum tuberosum]|nr:hypothetical protein KY285_007867 [Solanum tuberosum]